jgi:hypothetical protein
LPLDKAAFGDTKVCGGETLCGNASVSRSEDDRPSEGNCAVEFGGEGAAFAPPRADTVEDAVPSVSPRFAADES